MAASGDSGRKPKSSATDGKKRAKPGDTLLGLERMGEFIKAQRKMMELSQRELARLMEVSDPYVSQLERGLHEPSVRVLKSAAAALNVRAETMLAYAGLLDPEAARSSVVEAIQADPDLTGDQKSTLLSVYQNFKAISGPGGETGGDDHETDIGDESEPGEEDA